MQEIKLEIIDDKVKVTSPYHPDFVAKARNFRGKFNKAENAWYFDDSIINYVREAMIQYYGTTGETEIEYCSLLIKNLSDSMDKGPYTLFGRTIARAFGRDSGARLGDDIIFISGSYDSGGSVKNWDTRLHEATFEIQNFPLPATELEEVQEAINAGWCVIKTKKPKTEIKRLAWNAPEMYTAIAPFAMNRKIVREMDNISTSEKMEWFLKYEGSTLVAFCCAEIIGKSLHIKQNYSVEGDHKFEMIAYIQKEVFEKSKYKALIAYFKTEELKKAKKVGFKTTIPGKNWHKLSIER